jgi:radical SAM superfamily enzyme YgiQ (UPF0313 family)
MIMKKKVMLVYPPSRLYQRGEDRSQGNVADSTATTIRACNDLGYAASVLKQHGYDVYLRDFQSEEKDIEYFVQEFKAYGPDAIFMSITNATIFADLAIIEKLKSYNEKLVVVLKGALFFQPDKDLIRQLPLQDADYLVGGEVEFIIGKLLDAHFFHTQEIKSIDGILYKENGSWSETNFSCRETDLDSLPFPDRSLMNNSLYVRPDTGEPQATIATSRGCSANCIYCLTPKISGTRLRLRSPENIVAELKECFFKHKIRNFFFKSDTFTLNHNWVSEVCGKIINSELHDKISWVANSRTRPLSRETLAIMKKAGCWLVAFGFESGSEETLRKIKKGATVEDNLRAAQYAKELGLKLFGFYLIGFPWEDMSHLRETARLIYQINADFLELHIAIPYYGTALYELAQQEGLVTESILGRDYFNPPDIGTKYLSLEEVQKFRKNLLLKYHLRPSYIIHKLRDATKNPTILKNYCQFGLKLLKQSLT